jgi:hypothetical protein
MVEAKADLRKYEGELIEHVMPVGSYVLATKYHDGDPGDAWGVGFYLESFRVQPGGPLRHRVIDGDGNYIYGPKGFVVVRAGLLPDVGRWLVENADALQRSPPGSVNLWRMLTPIAFGSAEDATTGGAGDQSQPKQLSE